MVDLKLVSYIKENKRKGYPKGELINILKNNGWTKKEINSAYKFIEKSKKVSPNKKIQEFEKTKDPLFNFINQSLQKGISEREIRLALSSKGWKPELIDMSFRKTKFPIIKQIKEEKPQQLQTQRLNFKKIFKYILAFFFISALLSGTSGVYLYIQGMSTYVITATTGEELTGTCLEEDCSDIKEHAFSYTYDNILVYIVASLVITLVLLMLYGFLPFKTEIMWTYNILYFLLLIFIVFKWIMFQRA